MPRRTLHASAATALLLATAATARPASATAGERPLAACFPPRTRVCVEAPELGRFLARALDHPFVDGLLGSPLARAILAEGPGELEDALATATEVLGTDALEVLGRATAGGAALGVAAAGPTPVWAVVLVGDDAPGTRRHLETLLDHAGEAAGFPDAFARPHRQLAGADAWYVGDELRVAERAGVVVAGNDVDYLRDVLELVGADAGPGADAAGLERNARFRAASGAREARAPDDLLWAWIDLAGLREQPFGTGEPLAELAAARAEPAAQFLLGPSLAEAGTAASWSAALGLRGERLELALRAFGVDAAPELRARAETPAPRLPAPPAGDRARAECGRALVHRDLAAVYAHRAELFAADRLPALTQPISELAVLFGGKDLSRDVLPGLSPWIGVVLRATEFDADATPEIPLPAGALLFHLEEPEALGPELVAAFQTTVGIVNVDRAQEARTPLLLALSTESGVTISAAGFLPPADGDGVDVQYNLAPACARVGSTFVLGTHVELVRDVVRQLVADDDEAVAEPPGVERLVLRGPALAEFARANRAALVANGILNEGKSRAEAEGDADGLRLLLELVGELELELARPAADAVALDVCLTLAPADDAEAAR